MRDLLTFEDGWEGFFLFFMIMMMFVILAAIFGPFNILFAWFVLPKIAPVAEKHGVVLWAYLASLFLVIVLMALWWYVASQIFGTFIIPWSDEVKR